MAQIPKNRRRAQLIASMHLIVNIAILAGRVIVELARAVSGC